MSKQEVMNVIREAAEKQGSTPFLDDLERTGALDRCDVRRHFRKYTLAVRACGLEPRKKERTEIPMKKLFLAWATVARKRGRLPSMWDFPGAGGIGHRVFTYRFGGWRKVPEAMARYAKEQKLDAEWKDLMEMIARRKHESTARGRRATKPKRVPRRPLSPVYGAALTSGPMVNAPTNEQGVLFLFGAMAEKLGYKVTLVQQGFPDCEALIELAPGRWVRVRIEVEYESRNFRRHRHRVDGCEIIMCWIHNWPECPLEVVELSKIIG